MSFFDSLIDLGKSAVGFLSGKSIGASLARTALTGLALNQIQKSVNKANEIGKKDPGVRIQVDPDTEHKIPVVYGTAFLGGAVTDAVITNSNATMFYCLTICEQTGNIGLGSGSASVISFKEIYWDDNKLVFDTDGVTVKGYIDKAGVYCETINGTVKVYCYSGDSESPTNVFGYANHGLNAYAVMPNWTSNHQMENLIFAIVRVDYNAEKNVRGLANMRFKIQNSMTLPGDCIYDYMTNTRYGAGIDPAEINSL
jgi:hypothetical protein